MAFISISLLEQNHKAENDWKGCYKILSKKDDVIILRVVTGVVPIVSCMTPLETIPIDNSIEYSLHSHSFLAAIAVLYQFIIRLWVVFFSL